LQVFVCSCMFDSFFPTLSLILFCYARKILILVIIWEKRTNAWDCKMRFWMFFVMTEKFLKSEHFLKSTR